VIRVAVIGDRDPDRELHAATDAAVDHAATALGVDAATRWVGTRELAADPDVVLDADALWVAPGVAEAPEGARAGGARAQAQDRPLLGTCGGFQHVVVEFAANRCGLAAAHAEEDPAAPDPVICALGESLVGTSGEVHLLAGSWAAGVFGTPTTVESYACRYGINPQHRDTLTDAGLVVSGVDPEGTRVVELPTARFYLATLFVPQARSRPGAPHPLVVALLDATRPGPRGPQTARRGRGAGGG